MYIIVVKGIIKFVVFVAVVAGLWWGWNAWQERKGLQVEYTTVPVEKENILITIDATGTLKPYETVDVGAQVGGRIIEFGKDTEGKEVDDASYVKKDEVIARIDDVLIKSDISRAEASVAEARASIERAKADIIQSEAKHEQARKNRERAEKLGPGKALAESAYDQYIADEETTKAAVAVAKASLSQAEASLQSSLASLEKEQRNLSYTVITAPVDGVVVQRKVNIGQTVVASMNTPSLFILATDLKKMKVWSAVNEADIGNIYRGQKVVFTADAFPDREFEGTVNKIRLDATMTSNVVTYIVEIDTENPERILLPYLTADVKFIVHDLKNTLVVANSATRFMPDEDMIVPSELEAFKKKYAESQEVHEMGRGEKMIPLWYQEGSYVKPIWVVAGESNGVVTPVRPLEGYELSEGMQIVNSANRLDGKDKVQAAGGNKNPFMPNMPRRRGGGGGPPRR